MTPVQFGENASISQEKWPLILWRLFSLVRTHQFHRRNDHLFSDVCSVWWERINFPWGMTTYFVTPVQFGENASISQEAWPLILWRLFSLLRKHQFHRRNDHLFCDACSVWWERINFTGGMTTYFVTPVQFGENASISQEEWPLI